MLIYMNNNGKKIYLSSLQIQITFPNNTDAIYFAALKVNRRIILVVTKQDKLIGGVSQAF